MANYDDAVRLAQSGGGVPDVAAVRRFASRPGAAVNVEQGLAADLGGFLRASANEGSKEAYEFTEVNRSLSAGLALKGARWHRPEDTLGLAAVVNDLSDAARRYFAAGGIGILIGDGRLPRYAREEVLELYYDARVAEHLAVAIDFQHVVHPAYNPERGPVSIFGARLHSDF